MTLRLIQVFNALPMSFIADPSATFQPGQAAQLYALGNQIVCGVSDGTAPIGIIDDMNTNSFTAISIDEVVIATTIGTQVNGIYVTPVDLKAELENPNVVANSFTSDLDVILNTRNGVITIPSGTPLNFDYAGTGTPDSVRVVVSYAYQIPGMIGTTSIQGGRITVWTCRMFAATDQIEIGAFPLNANLYVNEAGLFTTRQPAATSPAIGLVTAPPTSSMGFLEFMWL